MLHTILLIKKNQAIFQLFREDSQIDFGTPNVNLTFGIQPPLLFFFYLKSSKTQTSAAHLLLEKGAEVKMKLQDLNY